ncbi:MAG: DMT family transporter [Devosia sp.]|uniref:DMT family transporter n=1 Tax=Devosia sp. TaxID=1871048 RepID=UPI001A3FF8CB|nr:DMT family transporter [Devosia sp.]MBL8599251.1 DMT family transporter [Devosia sp.]
MPPGVLYAFAAYALYSCCDAIIKGLGHGLSVYELAFFTTLFSLVPVFLTTPKGENWLYFWKLKNPLLVHLRGVSGVLGNLCIIFAFVTIPLAEAYSIAFLAPIFIVLISVTVLKETVSLQRWLILAASFIGVLIVVRPGFRDLSLGHLAALGSAFFGAITTTVLRRVAKEETRVSLIGMATLYIVVVNGTLMLVTGAVRVPTWTELAWLMLIGALGGTGNMLFIAATRAVQASRIAPLQYSQIFWAILFGAVFYYEYPDAVGIVGLFVIVIAGILNVLSGDARLRIFSRNAPAGAGPSTLREAERAAAMQAPDTPLEDPIAGASEATASSER